MIRTRLAVEEDGGGTGGGSGGGWGVSGGGGTGGSLLVLPLYASLSAEAQQKVFRKPEALMRTGYDRDRDDRDRAGRDRDGRDGRGLGQGQGQGQGRGYIRKCIVCTNIAETSITVDNVRYDTSFISISIPISIHPIYRHIIYININININAPNRYLLYIYTNTQPTLPRRPSPWTTSG